MLDCRASCFAMLAAKGLWNRNDSLGELISISLTVNMVEECNAVSKKMKKDSFYEYK